MKIYRSMVAMFLFCIGIQVAQTCPTNDLNDFIKNQGQATVPVDDEEWEEPEHQSSEGLDEDRSEVYKLLFNAHAMRKKVRQIKDILPGHLKILLEIACDYQGKGPSELGRLYNERIVASGHTDTKKISGMRDLYGPFFEKNKLVIIEDGKLEKLTEKGLLVLQVLKEEEAKGNVQPIKATQKSAIKSQATPSQKKQTTTLLRPDFYRELLGALDTIQARDKKSIQRQLKTNNLPIAQKIIPHFKTYLDKCLRDGWVEKVAGTEEFRLTNPGREKKQALDLAEIAKTLPVIQGEEILPEVNIDVIQNPVAYYLILMVGVVKQDFMDLKTFFESFKAQHLIYPGCEATMTSKSMGDYLRKLSDEYNWVEKKIENAKPIYRVRQQAITTYLESLHMRVLEQSANDNHLGRKHRREDSEDDLEEIEEDDLEWQNARKKR